MKLLVTGGAGFIGSNFVEHILKTRDDCQVLVLDALTYAGNLENFPEPVWNNPRFFFWHGSVCDRVAVEKLVSQVDVVIHFAAETHVDNSIHDYNTDDFIDSDVKGTQILLDAVRRFPIQKFIHISTSEVYGTALTPKMSEEHPLNPRSPYASAKCGADRYVYSYCCAFETPAVIVRPFNNYGPRQHVEKLIPRIITSCLQDQPFPLHGTGKPSRDWLYVGDHCEALDVILSAPIEKVRGEVFNIATGIHTDIYTIAKKILTMLGKTESLIERVEERPGQVNRHTGDANKIETILGWKAKTDLDTGLERTVAWYIDNTAWWTKLRHKELKTDLEDAFRPTTVRGFK